MLEDALIVGIVMAVTEVLKSLGVGKVYLPLAVLGISLTLSLLNAALFDPGTLWQPALLEGLKLGAIAGGIYGLGKAALGRS